MNHQKNPICDECGELQDKFKDLKTLKKDGKKIYLCKDCYRERRLKHREETINEAGIRDDLKELEKKAKSESVRKSYERKVIEKTGKMPRKKGTRGVAVIPTYIPKRYQKQKEKQSVQESEAPIKIKGSILAKPKKINTSLSLVERQELLRINMKKGMSFDDAKKAVTKFADDLKEIKQNSNTEEEVSKKKNEMLEELWNK